MKELQNGKNFIKVNLVFEGENQSSAEKTEPVEKQVKPKKEMTPEQKKEQADKKAERQAQRQAEKKAERQAERKS